jgi:hypothetical protein
MGARATGPWIARLRSCAVERRAHVRRLRWPWGTSTQRVTFQMTPGRWGASGIGMTACPWMVAAVCVPSLTVVRGCSSVLK